MTKIISFISYKGGAGRSFVTANIAEALILQGMNVVVVDLDVEAPGIANFSSTKNPRVLFSPDCLYRVNSDHIEGEVISKRAESYLGGDHVPLPGLLSPFSESKEQITDITDLIHRAQLGGKGSSAIIKLNSVLKAGLKKMNVYESRSTNQHPLEGRLFIVPIGGGYKRVPHRNPMRNPWVYYPPSNSAAEDEYSSLEGRGLMHGILQELMYLPNVHFTAELKSELVSRLRENNIHVDYILLDQRPGLEGRTMLSGIHADGVVLVSPTSRGGMRGTRKLAELIISYRKDEIRDKERKLSPPIIGCVISGLPEQKDVVDSVGESGFEAICGNDEQAALSETLLNAAAQRHAILPEKSLQYYYSLFKSALVSYELPKTFKSMPDEGYSSTTVTQELWKMLAQHSGGQTFNKHIAGHPISSAVFPLSFAVELRFHDRACAFRQFLAEQNAEDVTADEMGQVTLGLSLFSAHIRSLVLEEGKNDSSYRGAVGHQWDNIELLVDLINRGKSEDFNKVIQRLDGNSSWVAHWYSAMSYALIGGINTELIADEVRSNANKLALDALTKMESAQLSFVSRLNKDCQHGFANHGDWRISYLRALIERRKAEQDALALSNTLLDRARKKIEYLQKQDDIEQGQSWNWLSKCTYIRDVISRMYEQEAETFVNLEEYDNAWASFQHCLSELDNNRYHLVANAILDFAKECDAPLAREVYSQLVDELRVKLLNSSMRYQLLRPYCYALLSLYWVDKELSENTEHTREDADKENERRKLLPLFIEHMREWKGKQGSDNVSDKARALALTRLGEVYLEYAALEPDHSTEAYVQSALENLNEAVIWDIENRDAWLLVSVARYLSLKNHEAAALLHNLIDDINTKKKRDLEANILRRDAYYGVEQLIALLGQINWYADSEFATVLQYKILPIIRYLLHEHAEWFDKNIKWKMNAWLGNESDFQCFEPDSDVVAGLASVEWRELA